jgi:hypothetical protein
MFGGLFSGGERPGEDFDGLAGERRDENCCGETAVAQPFLRRTAVRRAFDVKQRTAFRQERSELSSLNAADLDVARTDRKHRHFHFAAKFGDVIRRAIQDGPGDPRVARHLRYLGKRASAHRFQNNSVDSAEA